ncbi:Solute carrier family 13 member 4 [Varanus komodoensis]|nr:Solute carrier family 13 member 4 [Varanus komodoensis]
MELSQGPPQLLWNSVVQIALQQSTNGFLKFPSRFVHKKLGECFTDLLRKEQKFSDGFSPVGLNIGRGCSTAHFFFPMGREDFTSARGNSISGVSRGRFLGDINTDPLDQDQRTTIPFSKVANQMRMRTSKSGKNPGPYHFSGERGKGKQILHTVAPASRVEAKQQGLFSARTTPLAHLEPIWENSLGLQGGKSRCSRMTMVRELLQARNLLLVLLIPLLLLPLPLLYPTSEASCAYVLIVTAVYWVSEAVPLGAAALVPAFLYPLFGVMKSSEVAAEYIKNTTLLLMGVICVAASVEKWNLHKRIALRMVMMAGAKPGMLLLCFMCCTTVISMWLSNTSTAAMVMPIVEAVLQELVNTEEDCESNGTPGNIILEERETIGLGDKHGQASLELIFINEDATTADFSSLVHSKNMNGVHMIANTIGTVSSKTNGQHLPQAQILVLPPQPQNVDLHGKHRYPSKHDHMVCKCLTLSVSYAATIGGLTTIIGTSTNLIFLEYFNK